MKSMTKRATIAGSFPESADIQSVETGIYASRLNDGTQVRVDTQGEATLRSLTLEGAGVSIETEIAEIDLSEAQMELASLRENLGSRIERAKQALAFLENPNSTSADLVGLREGLTSIL